MASTRFTPGIKAMSLVYLASLASALPALGEFKFQGCYTNDPNQPSLAGKQSSDRGMTLQMCAAACDGYQWFGVEDGTQCYCGASLAPTAEKRPDTECSVKCRGSKCQTCGAVNRINVFWTGRDATSELSATSTATSSAEVTTESITGTPETPATTTAEATSTVPAEESTTTPEITPTRTLPAEVSSTATTACEITTVFLPTPTNCWASVPAFCTNLNRPGLPYNVASRAATLCTSAFNAEGTVMPEIESCFAQLANPVQFTAVDAYSCVASANAYCQTSTLCKADATVGAPAGPVATNALGDGGFEDGNLWPATGTQFGSDDIITASVSTEQAHTGTYALKTVYSNTSGGSRTWAKTVRLTAGVTYEMSWWLWSENSASSTHMTAQVLIGATNILFFDVYTSSQPVGQWARVSNTFTAPASYATVTFAVGSNMGAAGNRLYVDDISIVPVA